MTDKLEERHVTALLRSIGEDTNREGIRETPRRYLDALKEWFAGYKEDPEKLLKSFTDGAESYKFDEMVLVSGIPVYSHCEHHLAPIIGTCYIGYLPDGKILGLSKFVRIVECFARRLQVQERLTQQLVEIIHNSGLHPRGVGVLIEARHLCMESRGVCKQGTITTTSAMRGNMLLNHGTRAEFLELVRRSSR